MRGMKQRTGIKFASTVLAFLLAIGGVGSANTVRVMATPLPAASADAESAVKATVDLLDRHGRVQFHGESSMLNPSGALKAVRAVRHDAQALAKWRQNVDRMAKVSKAAKARLAGTTRLIDALSASSPAAFHEQVQKLGVTVRTMPATDVSGFPGVRKEFVVRGAVKLRLFIPTRPAPPADDSASDDDIVKGPNVGPTVWAVQEDCGGEPCATQQELDDALAALLSIDEENNMLDAEMQAEWAAYEDYCSQDPWACEDGSQLDEELPSHGPSVSELRQKACSSEFWNFTGAVLSTNGAVILGVAAILAATTAPIAALAAAGTVVVAAGGLAWSWSGALSLMDCARRRISAR
jgi:hypothetical protein